MFEEMQRKCPLVCPHARLNMVKCPLGCPSAGENVITLPSRVPLQRTKHAFLGMNVSYLSLCWCPTTYSNFSPFPLDHSQSATGFRIPTSIRAYTHTYCSGFLILVFFFFFFFFFKIFMGCSSFLVISAYNICWVNVPIPPDDIQSSIFSLLSKCEAQIAFFA